MSTSVPVSPDTKNDSLELRSKAYRLDGNWYLLCEASGAAAVAYRNACARAAKMAKGKVVGVDNIAEAEPLLLSKCLFVADLDAESKTVRVRRDGARKPMTVPVSTLDTWPNRILHEMFDWVKENSDGLVERSTKAALKKQIADLQEQLNDLEEDEPAPKDEPGSTTDSSGTVENSAVA